MGDFREIYAATVEGDPGRVFYTIRVEDVGKTTIHTQVGPIHTAHFMGRVLRGDVGKRIYRVQSSGDWAWQVENEAQLKRRLARG